jgi:hypothetical protein
MKKIMIAMILVFSLFIIVACSEDGERSFSIDKVTIDAHVDTEGIIHVRELYTYTFDGAFEGMTRSIESDVKQFKAYLIDEEVTDPTVSTDGLETLTIEKDESIRKIYSESQDETKKVLYSYIVEGSVKKYQDIADIRYAFFDESNKTDLHDVEISIHTPENILSENTHFFLHGDGGGELTATENHVVYRNVLLEASDNSEVRLIFPAEELNNMETTKDKQMVEKILTAEMELIERSEHLDQYMNKAVPIMWILIAVVIIIAIVLLMKHPNRYRGNKSIDEFTQILEGTDPLFISYLSLYGYLQDKSIIAALFSLKQRGIVTLQEVTSVIDEKDTTFRFTWKKDFADVDLADGFLREWLFTEEDEEEGAYFLLESVIDNEDEAESVREKKAEEFGNSYDKWSGLIQNREEYQHLKRPFYGFSRLSSILIIATFSSFYYITKVDVISQTEQLVLPLILAILGIICLIFSRQKLLILFYYPYLIFASLIAFTMTTGTILTVIFYIISFLILLIIPSKYWREDILKIIYAIKESRKFMKNGDYPVGSVPSKLEKRLEYAIILDVGEKYAEHYGKTETVNKLDYPLISNPNYAIQSFSSGNLVLLSLIAINSSGSSYSSTSSTSSTGGGGAGAF